MKVLMIANKSEIGGAPRSMMDLALLLQKRHNVEVILALHKEGLVSQFCKANGINYIITGHEPIAISKGSTKLRRIAKGFLTPYYTIETQIKNDFALVALPKKIDLQEIDFIHTNSNRDGFGALISRRYGIKHIWHIREFGEEDYDIKFLRPFSYKYMSDNVYKFVAISDAVKAAWEKRGIPEEKIVRIYNGINLDKIENYPDRGNLYKQTVRIVVVGTVCPAKGQIDIINALEYIEDSIRKNISIDFIGDGPSDYISSLKAIASKKSVGGHLHFLGYRDNVGQIIKDYTIGLVSSRSEAFGRITPEYMAAGLITIASDKGANPEIITDGKNGFIYKYGDPRDLARIVEKVCALPNDEKVKISKNAEQDVRLRFNAIINADSIFKLYQRSLTDN